MTYVWLREIFSILMFLATNVYSFRNLSKESIPRV